MRILLIGVAIKGGGAEQVIVDLARGFASREHEVMVAFLEGTDDIVPTLEEQGIRCVRLLKRREFAAGPLADFTPSCVLGFRRLISQFKPDIVHSHIPRPTLWAAWAKRLLSPRPPFIYTEHNVQEAYPSWAKWVYQSFLPVTEHVVCISEAATNSFIARWQWPETRVSKIWNGIAPARIAPSRSPDEVRHDLNAPQEAQIVCNVGNVTSRKAQEILVEAMAAVSADVPVAKCWIAGGLKHEPATAEMIQETIDARGLKECVQLLGPRRDVPDLLAACDVFVLSSRQEGFPITILEAMAARKPVVATAVGGCAEAVVDGETGLIVPPEDPDALAEALTYVLTHPDEARQMGKAGRQRVEENFTTDAMVEKHLAVYERVQLARA